MNRVSSTVGPGPSVQFGGALSSSLRRAGSALRESHIAAVFKEKVVPKIKDDQEQVVAVGPKAIIAGLVGASVVNKLVDKTGDVLLKGVSKPFVNKYTKRVAQATREGAGNLARKTGTWLYDAGSSVKRKLFSRSKKQLAESAQA
ncbi:MAG TPA: hypothetical protein V6C99_10500 [Oculatellaceae cyanobacterium]|jgi:hypothetical protein